MAPSVRFFAPRLIFPAPESSPMLIPVFVNPEMSTVPLALFTMAAFVRPSVCWQQDVGVIRDECGVGGVGRAEGQCQRCRCW